jgi:transcription antitermination factor NusG
LNLNRSVTLAVSARERDGFVELPQEPPLFRVGQTVRIAAGPFEGKFALYQGMKSRDRVALLLSLLGGQMRVTLSKVHVEVAH